MKISFSLKWFDAWVGLYVDEKSKPFKYYFCPFPCCVFKITFLGR